MPYCKGHIILLQSHSPYIIVSVTSIGQFLPAISFKGLTENFCKNSKQSNQYFLKRSSWHTHGAGVQFPVAMFHYIKFTKWLKVTKNSLFRLFTGGKHRSAPVCNKAKAKYVYYWIIAWSRESSLVHCNSEDPGSKFWDFFKKCIALFIKRFPHYHLHGMAQWYSMDLAIQCTPVQTSVGINSPYIVALLNFD